MRENDRTGFELGQYRIQDSFSTSLFTPVNRVDIPLNDLIACITNCCDNIIVVFTVRCSEQGGALSDYRLKNVIIFLEFVKYL